MAGRKYAPAVIRAGLTVTGDSDKLVIGFKDQTMIPALTRRLYVVAWLMLGAIATLYLFTLLQPARDTGDMVASVFAPAGSPMAKKTTAPDDPSLSRALVHMRNEIKRLKTSLASANEKNAAQKATLKTLAGAVDQTTTAALPANTGASQPGDTGNNKPALARPAPKVEITMLDMPGDGFARGAGAVSNSPLPIAGQNKPTRTLFAVELANGLKADEIDVRWAGIKRRHTELLGQLQPRGVKAHSGNPGEKGRLALVAGPFNNATAAAQLCARLITAGAQCKGTIFAGTPVGGMAAR